MNQSGKHDYINWIQLFSKFVFKFSSNLFQILIWVVLKEKRLSVTVIAVGNEIWDQSSNSEREYLRFTLL